MIKLLAGGSPCFGSGTMIYTENGYKPIEEIIVGDKVLTHKNRFRSVTAIMSKTTETISVKAQGFLETITTKEHPYYSVKKGTKVSDKTGGVIRDFSIPYWKNAGELTTNDFIGIVVLNKEENPLNLTHEDCWILGRYTADGHYRLTKRKNRINGYQYQVIFSIGNSKLEEFKNNVKRHFSCYPHTKSVYRCVISSKELLYILKDYDFGVGAKNKQIPSIIMNLPKELLSSYLDGYYSGDGHRDKWDNVSSTVSKKLALGLCMAIAKAKLINSTIHYKIVNPQKILEGRLINQSNYYIVNYKNSLADATQAYITKDIIWNPIRRIEQTEIKIVYNLSVEEDESYTANNAIVHNCTHWSISQKNNRETKAEGIGWELFKNYVIAKEKYKPDYFLYENNKSMSIDIRNAIDTEFIRPFVESDDWEECLLQEQPIDKYSQSWQFQHKQTGEIQTISRIMINSALLTAQQRCRYYWHNIPNVVQPKDKGILLRDIIEQNAEAWQEKAYTLTTRCCGAILSDTLSRHRHTMVAEPVRIGTIESGEKSIKSDSQAIRVYSCDGKSINIMSGGGGGGGKTGLYALPFGENLDGKAYCLDANYWKGSSPDHTLDHKVRTQVIEPHLKQKGPIYEVKDKIITINEKQYSINLADGTYIVRKLTVSEARKCQTIPDWYLMPCSSTQNYRMIGNGWSCDVISHILSFIPNIKLEEIEVLSMYDGMSNGHIALDILGANVVKYYASEIDKYAIKTTMTNYPNTIQIGDAFQVRNDNFRLE